MYDGDLNPIYTISCGNIATKASGIIQTKWCDVNGGYLSFTTNFDVTPVNPTPTLPPPAPSGIDKCRNGPRSTCSILGPSVVSVPAGKSYKFSVTLQCPVKFCASRWTATFGACGVTVTYKNVNPTYTITAPTGSEGRGGSVLTEWCDGYGGYMNWTTNFLITGSDSTPTAQQAAQLGVMAAGESSAAAEDGNDSDWRQTGWVIFLFCLLAIMGTIFLCALLRLWYKRVQAKNYATVEKSAQRRSSDPNSNDFQSVGDSPVQGSNAVIHGRREPLDP